MDVIELRDYFKRHWDMPTDRAAERFANLLIDHWEEVKAIVERPTVGTYLSDHLFEVEENGFLTRA